MVIFGLKFGGHFFEQFIGERKTFFECFDNEEKIYALEKIINALPPQKHGLFGKKQILEQV